MHYKSLLTGGGMIYNDIRNLRESENVENECVLKSEQDTENGIRYSRQRNWVKVGEVGESRGKV